MARLTVLVWNIEELGVKFGSRQLELLRAHLVAVVAAAAEANVIVIQELRRPGVALLSSLTAAVQAAVGGTWHYDWLPGALTASSGAANSFNDLGFDPVANSEGYAVLWQEGALSALGGPRLSAGVDSPVYNALGPHYISLVTTGQKLVPRPKDSIPITFQAPTGALGFPRSTCPNLVGGSKRLRSGEIRPNRAIESTLRVRRPCTVRLATVDVPVVAYHAPVGQNGSRSDYYGSLIGFASAQLQGDRAVYAGDLNVVSAPAQQGLLQRSQQLGYEVSTYAQMGSGGPVEPMASVVHYVNHQGTGFRHGVTGVLGSARDYGFLRKGGQDGTLLVYDALGALPAALRAADQPTDLGNAVLDASASLKSQIGGVRVGDVVDAYLRRKQLPQGTDDFTALAIIYRELISDHLPVAISYQI